MSRQIAVATGVLACTIAMLHGGCRVGYDLLPQLVGAGASAGDSPGGGPSAGASGADGGNTSAAAGGGASAGEGGGASDGDAAGGPAGQGGEDSSTAGEGGMGAGGEAALGSLPPLPCAEPFVWWTDFSSDPTALDDNGDAQPDWVIRGGAPFDVAELVSGIWRPTAGKALDSFPPVNFSGRTQARVKMRDTDQVGSGTPTSFAGALFWINLDYTPSDFLAVFSSISTLDGAAYDLGIFAQAGGNTDTLAGPYRVPADGFVVLELDFDPASGAVSAWVDGTALPVAPPGRQAPVNADQFATAIAPQGTGEFDELWVATCRP